MRAVLDHPHTPKRVVGQSTTGRTFRKLLSVWPPDVGIAVIKMEARLCLLYRITHNLCYFDSSVFALSMFCSHRRFHPLFLKHAHPFAHTNSYFYSFVPHTITLWNSLNTTTVTAPSLATFRNSLNYPLSL